MSMNQVKYQYLIETAVTTESSLTFQTKKATVQLHPNPSRKNEIESADVVVDGPISAKTELIAKKELIKVLLRHVGVQGKVLGNARRWEEIQSGKSSGAVTKGLAMVCNSRYIAPQNSEAAFTLKADPDGDETPILQYYEALGRDHPIDKYREMFKVIEYLSGPKGKNVHCPEHLKAGLDNKQWRLPVGIESLSAELSGVAMDRIPSEVIRLLCQYRDKCSHLRETYGIPPLDNPETEKIEGMLPMLDTLVKYSLEINPRTKDITKPKGESLGSA